MSSIFHLDLQTMKRLTIVI